MAGGGLALRYASLGFAVFPLAPNSKVPLISKKDGGRGCHDATKDIEQIEAWWNGEPKANVAIAAGPMSGCWVLDVDPETDPEGAAWLAAREAEFGPLPVTPEAKTLKGGRHLLFAWDDARPVGNRVNFRDPRTNEKIKGLDARGDGGYIVAAPSFVREVKRGRTWEGSYQWLDDRKPSATPVAQAPDWLFDAVLNKAQAQVQETFVPRERREGDGYKYGHRALEAECQEIMTAPPGGRDQQIMSSAFKIGQLVAGGEIPREDAEDSLMNAALIRSQRSAEPVPFSELQDKIARALDKGGEKPRSAPARPERGRPALRVVGGSQAKPKERVDPETGEVFEDDPDADTAPENAGWAMELNWSLTDKGSLKPTSMNNLTLMLEHHPAIAGHLALNRFSYQVWVRGGLPSDRGEEADREWQDNDEVALAGWLNRLGLTPGVQTVGQVVRLIAARHSFDPVQEYLERLAWDGKPRLDNWLVYYAGAEGSSYTKTVGPKFCISAVARVMEPGCKVDTMLVLEGPQGLKKSTLAKSLFGPEWFSDQIEDVTSKESSIQIQGLWCVEVSEMDGFSRADDRAVKAFLSRTDDRYRPPYGRNTVTRHRRCVFIGTLNPEGSGWIKDATGGRRYWPVKVTLVDIVGIMRDRDQLWAEAVHRFRQGEQWWLDDHEESEAKAEQTARQTSDLWDDKIREWLGKTSATYVFRNSEVVDEALGIRLEARDFRVEKRVGNILTRMKCRQAKGIGADGKPYRGWIKPLEEGQDDEQFE